jgi:hypothetical protein
MLNHVVEIREGKGNSKYEADIFWNGELLKNVSFGDRRYQQYKDRTPLKLYSKLDHMDKDRLRLFHIRHRNNNGPSAVLSKKYLW